MRFGTICVGLAVAVSFVMACGGSQSSVQQPAGAASAAPSVGGAGPDGATSASPSSASAPGAPASSAPASSAAVPGAAASSAPDPGKPAERPFASSSVEAQSLIQNEIEARMKPLWDCVEAYRTKKHDAHKTVVVEVGIDQEGHLLGITAANAKRNGELDPALRDCMFSALHGAPFPRSHAGVISVRQTFSDAIVNIPQ